MFAIVSVERPVGQLAAITGAWPSFRDDTAHSRPLPAGSSRPAENLWLLPLPSGSAVLANVLQLAGQWGLAHQVLYFEGDPLVYQAPARKL